MVASGDSESGETSRHRGRRRHAGSGFGRLLSALSSHASQQISMKKILIIEDDQRIARALKIRFESKGYETAIASNASLRANLALQAHPDLIILDLGLPDGNGLQLAEKFQSQPETQHTPIIFFPANKDPNLRRRAMEMRIAGLFDKPYDPEELLATARYALGEMVPL